MINLVEWRRFSAMRNRVPWMGATTLVKLANGNEITVHKFGENLKQFDYFYHPQFGVVRNLGNWNIDKSPLCDEIDKTLEEMYVLAKS